MIRYLDLVGTVIVDVAHSASDVLGVGHRRPNGDRRAVIMKRRSVLTCQSVRPEDISSLTGWKVITISQYCNGVWDQERVSCSKRLTSSVT